MDCYLYVSNWMAYRREKERSTLTPFYGLADFIAALWVLFSIIIIVLVYVEREGRVQWYCRRISLQLLFNEK